MKTRLMVSIGTAALMVSGAVADARTPLPADLAKRAARALAKADAAAVALAEQTVAAAPDEAAYRALLARAYLQAGRFASARDASADALRLQPGDGRSALNLALASIATGDWQGARAVLAANGGRIGATDLGLAMALAGDPAGGVAVLMQAAREPGATPKTRQNLALALAMAGQWPLARAVAAADMSPADVDARIADWARFVQPTAASDQVASLLGVRAVADGGQPATLALATPATAPATAATGTLAAAIEPTPVVAPAMIAPVVTFGPRREVVQALPASSGRPAGRAKVGRGNWYVQLGAYENAAVAADMWRRISGDHPVVGGYQPQGAVRRRGGNAFYVLSVGGFSRNGAAGLCRSVRADKGDCFIRRGVGEALAQWAGGGAQLASR